ncbi:MAG: S8 family serine peptidase, partial [Chloroflexota bacterium]|nr:S8 family serine peptidase [Chloroflexota bacterium]
AVAVDNASIAGVTVVMSAGNSGPSAYITGSPGVATRGISVAAIDAVPSFPSVVIDMATGDDIVGINANGETDDLPLTEELNYFVDDPATPCNTSTGEFCEQLGDRAAHYVFNDFQPGQIAVTQRGITARIDRAKAGDAAGASAVIMVNNSSGLPPFEGPIGDVDIPFVGVSNEVNGRFLTDDGQDATISEGPELDNPGFKHTASFTSGGPRRFDNEIKPDVAAPGVGVFSVAGETVNNGKTLSGTSMASPAVAGVAALVQEANPSWTPREIKAAIIGTAKPSRVDPYEVRLSGAGVVNPKKAVRATNLAFVTPGVSSLSYGYQELNRSYSESRSINIVNDSSSARTYRLSNEFQTDTLGADVSISPSVVTVPANSRRMVSVTISFSRADAAALPDVAPFHGPDLAQDDLGQLFSPLTHVAGAVIAQPTSGGNSIRVPWFIAPRGISRIGEQPKEAYTQDPDSYDTSVRVTNYGVHRGFVDVFQWGLQDGNDGLDGIDIRAAGVQSLPAEVCTGTPDATDECLVFAVNTWDKWNNASDNEFDILINTDEDEALEYAVIGIDAGAVFGTLDGIYISLILDLTTGGLVDAFFATAPNNGTTMLLPVLASELGLAEGQDEDFEYFAQSFDFYDDDGTLTQFDTATTGINPTNGSELANYRAFDPVLSNGQLVRVKAGASKDIPLSVDKDGYDPDQGHKGWMLVTLEDGSLDEFDVQFQADLVPVGDLPPDSNP